MTSHEISGRHKKLWDKLQKIKEEELKARTPESKIGKMIDYLKQLDEHERIFCVGDSPGAFVSGTLISITREGIEHHGNLDGEYVDAIGPLTEEEIEEIQKRIQGNDLENDDIEVIALRKGCDLKKKNYYAYNPWYREMGLEEIEHELDFYDTYEDAFQCFGIDVECYDNLETWDSLSNSDIERYYAAVLKFKTGETV